MRRAAELSRAPQPAAPPTKVAKHGKGKAAAAAASTPKGWVEEADSQEPAQQGGLQQEMESWRQWTEQQQNHQNAFSSTLTTQVTEAVQGLRGLQDSLQRTIQAIPGLVQAAQARGGGNGNGGGSGSSSGVGSGGGGHGPRRSFSFSAGGPRSVPPPQTPAGPPPAPQRAPSSAWEKRYARNSYGNAPYWYNRNTGESRWTEPQHLARVDAVQLPQTPYGPPPQHTPRQHHRWHRSDDRHDRRGYHSYDRRGYHSYEHRF